MVIVHWVKGGEDMISTKQVGFAIMSTNIYTVGVQRLGMECMRDFI